MNKNTIEIEMKTGVQGGGKTHVLRNTGGADYTKICGRVALTTMRTATLRAYVTGGAVDCEKCLKLIAKGAR